MTTEVIETERGMALLLPLGCAAKAGEVQVSGTLETGLFVWQGSLHPEMSAEEWLSQPEHDNGLVAPEDLPPEPVPSF